LHIHNCISFFLTLRLTFLFFAGIYNPFVRLFAILSLTPNSDFF